MKLVIYVYDVLHMVWLWSKPYNLGEYVTFKFYNQMYMA